MVLVSWAKISCAPLASACLMAFLLAAQTTQAQQAIQFTNVTRASGINFTHFKGNKGVSVNLEEFGPGVCVTDYDGDGWQDIYFVNARDLYDRGIKVQNALYHNNGDGTFTDATNKAGVPGTGFGLGCVWGDYDNDGHPDLFVTQYGRNVLYHNNGDGTFTDVTDKAGVAGMDFGAYFHAGATFFDYDRDGKLDLYVGSYVAFPPGAQRYCKIGGLTSSCPPSVYPGSPSLLYHNNGDGTFTNVTKQAGMYQPQGKNLAVGVGDYDKDGWPDLFVANDGINAYLYHNEHNGTFKEEGSLSGMAFTGQGLPMAAMCISLGDYDNDGWLDLYISDFQGSSDHVWKNDGQGQFDEVSDRVGLTVPTRGVLSFGGGFFDYDNDGWLDLFVANGHVYPEIEQVFPEIHYKQINSLFHNNGHSKFTDVTKTSGDGFDMPHVGRGVAFADFDNDGFFVSFKLVGTKSNRDAMGARLKLTAGGITQIREIEGGGSYMSQSDLRAHFGLGSGVKIDKLEISWPSGAKQTFTDFPADQFYSVQEGTDVLAYQPFVKAGRNKLVPVEPTKSSATHPVP